MSDNRLGDDQEIPTPRDQPFSGNDDFGVMRALDGRRAPEDQVSPDSDLVRNIHEPNADGYGLVEVALFILILAVALVVLFRVL